MQYCLLSHINLSKLVLGMEKLEMRSVSPPVIDSKFCMPYTVHLIVKPKKRIFKSTFFEVLDTNGNLLLKIVKGCSISMNKDLLLLDATGFPVATLRHKNFSWHDGWRVYRGKNTNDKDAVFRVKRKNGLTLNVFMGSKDEKKDKKKKKKKKKGDFDVVGLPPTVYMGDSTIADVNNNFSWGGDDVKKGFKVRVGAGTDYAFIISLIIIQKEMAKCNTASGSAIGALVDGGINIAVALAGGGGGRGC